MIVSIDEGTLFKVVLYENLKINKVPFKDIILINLIRMLNSNQM